MSALPPEADIGVTDRHVCFGHERTHAPQQNDTRGCTVNSITSSAWACRVGGMARPSALAVLRLMASFSMVATAETPSLIDVREDLSAMVFVARCQRSRLNVFVRAWPAPSPDGLVIKASQRMLSAGEQRETQHFDRSHSSSTFNDRSRTQFENSLLPVQVSISLFV